MPSVVPKNGKNDVPPSMFTSYGHIKRPGYTFLRFLRVLGLTVGGSQEIMTRLTEKVSFLWRRIAEVWCESSIFPT